MKRISLSFRDISLHRPVLYGFAALWIALYHMSSSVGPLTFFRALGACGVDMFVLLTGPGLYRSMEKNPHPLAFWKRRLMRVYLPTMIVILFTYGFSAGSLQGLLTTLSMIFFWFEYGSYWYAPFILTVYLIYPLIYFIQKRKPALLWALLALSVAGCFCLRFASSDWIEVCGKAVSRFPILIVGCLLTQKFERGDRIPLWMLPASLATFIILMLLKPGLSIPYFARMLAYIPLAIFMTLTVTLLAKFCTRGAVRQTIYRFFALCGGVSLEIYLLFSRVCTNLKKLPIVDSSGISSLRWELTCLVLTIFFALLLNRFCQFFFDQFRKIKIPE